MRTSRIIAAAVAAGVIGAGAVVTPVVLAADSGAGEDSTGTTYGRGWSDSGERGSWGYGDMRGPGGMGQDGRMGHGGRHGMGYGDMAGGAMGGGGMLGRGGAGGDCDSLGGLAQGTLTSDQEQALADQAELEKLAQDAYLAFAESTGDPRFEHVAHAEAHHLAALRSLMERYGVEDPTEGLADGEFSSDEVAERYRAAVDAGSGSLADALDTARELEQEDLDGLNDAADGLDAPDVEQVYEHLTVSSERHLEVFSD